MKKQSYLEKLLNDLEVSKTLEKKKDKTKKSIWKKIFCC